MSAPRVMVAMSGGVDSSVAAALLQRNGYDVTGVTMKLWGGPQDSGCCSVADVDDARRVADHLGIPHHVFNFGDDFDLHVVEPYVDAHARGETPNPCIECNRHVKFDKLLRRASALDFELVATGHHAQVRHEPLGNGPRLARGADRAKDQSYVLHMLREEQLGQVLFPVGRLTKAEVRALAADLDLRTATKAESQDVCFIARTRGGRGSFLGERLPLTPGRVVDRAGNQVGAIDAVELVTIGQRKGLGVSGNAEARYAVDVDVASATVTIGPRRDLFVDRSSLTDLCWAGEPVTGDVEIQISAHGQPARGTVTADHVVWDQPHRRVAPGQSLVFYEDDLVVGSATAT